METAQNGASLDMSVDRNLISQESSPRPEALANPGFAHSSGVEPTAVRSDGRHPRTNYILIDFENVQPTSFEVVEGVSFRLILFVGATQAKLPFELVASIQRHGEQVEYIKMLGTGPNTLDLHIALRIGQIVVEDPTGYFHIISKDTGFDPLVKYLRSQKVAVCRYGGLAEIPIAKRKRSETPSERVQIAWSRLERFVANKPRRLKTLKSTLSASFLKQLDGSEIESIVNQLIKSKKIRIENDRVIYCTDDDACTRAKG